MFAHVHVKRVQLPSFALNMGMTLVGKNPNLLLIEKTDYFQTPFTYLRKMFLLIIHKIVLKQCRRLYICCFLIAGFNLPDFKQCFVHVNILPINQEL